jgi:hypothetical protein
MNTGNRNSVSSAWGIGKMAVLKLGAKYRSAVCDTQIMVIRTVPEPLDLRCGGAPMAGPNEEVPASAIAEGFAEGTLIGKRYIDAGNRIELLCTKGGKGSLSLGTEALQIKVPKALPSSD